jgi:hypothetical protein
VSTKSIQIAYFTARNMPVVGRRTAKPRRVCQPSDGGEAESRDEGERGRVREQRAEPESREQRAEPESREQRAESREQRAKVK